jgi:hypothetical protein
MAVPFAKLPGVNSRTLRNTVPGLRPRDKGRRSIYGPVLGVCEDVEKRHKKIGRCLGWMSLTLAVLFVIGGVLRLSLPGEVLAREGVKMVFGTLGVVSAMGIHLFLFAAEALRGRDAPRAVLAVVIFWVTFIFCGIW